MGKTKKSLISFIMLALFASSFTNGTFASTQNNLDIPENGSSSSSLEAILEQNYTSALQEWNDVPVSEGVHKRATPMLTAVPSGRIVPQSDSYGYHGDTIRWNDRSEVSYEVNVDKTGLYQISFDYYVLDGSILATEGYMKINGEYPYYEARRIIFHNVWNNDMSELKLDRYGNELAPKPQKAAQWQTTLAYDSSYFHMDPLLFKLEAGNNVITLTNTRGDLLLGDVTVESPLQIHSYDQYLAGIGANPNGQETNAVVIEGEGMAFKNDSSVRPTSEQNSALTPYDIRKRLLNVLEGESWQKGGQSVTWNFEVPKTGFYNLSVKYKQSDKYDLPVYREIEIDGKVPFHELENYAFPYGKDWQNETLGNGDEPYWFYLEQGSHSLRMTVNLSNLRPLAEQLTTIMKEISELTLEIQKLTGNKTDAYRDWSLTEYIPNLEQYFTDWTTRLEAEYENISTLNPRKANIGEIFNLNVAVKQLRKLAEEPDELPNRLTMLSTGSSSVSQLLGDLLQRISESPMSVDRIYVHHNYKLPSPKAGWLKRMADSIQGFFLSFGKKDYTATENKKGDELEVWVSRPRQFVEMMQKMIDEEFTPASGIKVKLSIMPDENKLILANASGGQPDVALGVNNWLPYELAIRGASLDLRTFDDYAGVIREFSEGAVIPLVFEDGVYALPETQNFWVLFYRKDIMESLKLPIPNTWEDVVNILPELQRLGLNFYEPNAMFGGFKPFVSTTPFIYQFGGELYKDDGMSTAIDSEEALKGINFMTELFTIYNVPQSVPNFYNHFRYGTLPVGISDFQTYIQLRTAAPEIANWWEIGLHPGVDNGHEIVRWAPAGGTTGMIFKATTRPNESWSFLKWWMSANTQIEYANMVQTTYGETYMWNTANMTAFEQLPWPEKDKEVIMEQFKWVREPSRVPGAYMVEREISNVWNKVVFDAKNPRTTIDDSIILIDREIKKKMEEFGYYKDGRILKPYSVPTISNINKWVER